MAIGLDHFARPAASRRHQLGDHRITSLPDGAALLEPRAWLPGSDQVWAEHLHLINPDGYLAYTITSPGARLISFGDAMRTPSQITHPELISAVDDDPAASVATCRRLIDDLAVHDTLGVGVHFADVQLGRVTTSPCGELVWQPE
ncbi:hypothetical protein AB0B25_07955 [Nocardia sp. NPDC049190]|uniref:hypothetical protein n=1 Tax=Nocardia sp. NPDC049190 TaxID=3155650 RepID=UPI0033EDE92C